MAKLPPIEIKAILARDELSRGKQHREKALALLAEAGDGPIARELRATVSKRGRQPFGAKYLWWDIGVDNDELRERGMSSNDRMAWLSRKYPINDATKLRTAIAKYERAVEEIRAIDR